MLSPLNKKLARDLRTHLAQAAAVTVIVALGIVVFAGLLLAGRQIGSSVDGFYERTRYEDFSAMVGSAPLAIASELERLPNVSEACARIEREVISGVRGSKPTLRVISLPERGRSEVNDIELEYGRLPRAGEPGACVVEHHLAKAFSLKSGDSITVFAEGGPATLRVTGSAFAPDFLRLIRGNVELATDPKEFGVAYVRESEARRLFGKDAGADRLLLRVGDEKRLDETMRAVEPRLAPYGLVAMTAGRDEMSAAMLYFDMSNVRKISAFFAVLLLGVASLALYITLTRMVAQQQQQIGVAMAVGYDKRSLLFHYLGYGIVLGTAGSVLGVAGGYLISLLFLQRYGAMLGLPPIAVVAPAADIMLAGFLLGISFSLLGALVPTRLAVGMKPAEAMRVEAGFSLKVRKRARAPAVGRRLGFPAWLRSSFRNITRNRRRAALTCLGVLVALSALVAASGAAESMRYAIEKQMDGVVRWDVSATFSTPQGKGVLATVAGMEGVSRAEQAIIIPGRVTTGGRSADVELQAYSRGSTLHHIYPTPGSEPYPGPGEILLNQGLTHELPVKRGDRVEVDTAAGRISLEVAGFTAEPFGGTCYANLEYLQGLAGGAVFNIALAKVKPSRERSVESAMKNLPGVFVVTTRSAMQSFFNQLIGVIKSFMNVIYVLIFAVGFAIVFTMVTINIIERRSEVATVRTLGAGMGIVFWTLTVETLSVGLIAVVPGVLLGRASEWLLMTKLMSSRMISVEAVFSTEALVVIVAAFLAAMVLAELLPLRQLGRLDLARVIKERAG